MGQRQRAKEGKNIMKRRGSELLQGREWSDDEHGARDRRREMPGVKDG